jgi:dCMP deaminase
MELSKEWQEYFIGLAIAASKKSKDGSSKFGAILVRPDKTVASFGFNGFPKRIKDHDHMLNAKTVEGRQKKYMRIVHAEANCLNYNRDHDTTGYHMFVNGLPCEACALRICSTGVDYVYYYNDPVYDYETRWAESIAKSKQLFKEAGIRLIKVEYGDPHS